MTRCPSLGLGQGHHNTGRVGGDIEPSSVRGYLFSSELFLSVLKSSSSSISSCSSSLFSSSSSSSEDDSGGGKGDLGLSLRPKGCFGDSTVNEVEATGVSNGGGSRMQGEEGTLSSEVERTRK